MSKQEPEQPQPDSEPTTFTEIGGSPVPGFILRSVLRGHTDRINRFAWSPDGAYLASPSDDKTIRIWDARNGVCVHTLQGHTTEVHCLAWSPDGHLLASGSGDMGRGCIVHVWDVGTRKILSTISN